MKNLKLITAVIVLFLAGSSKAQITLNVNIGGPPQWGPAGYDDVRYYYLPDVEAYYDVQSSLFIYYEGGVWVREINLPVRCRSYDLYNGYKVVMSDYKGDSPYVYFVEHRKKYGKGYHGAAQKTIGQKPGNPNGKNTTFSSDQSNKKNEKYTGNGTKKNNKQDNGHGGGKGKKK